MESRLLTELAHDIQTGLGSIDVPDFEQLRTVGMASTLAMHIRGLGEIQYEVLRKVSDHYFNIPSYALKEVLHLLAEIEYVRLSTTGARIDSVIPDVPRFQDVQAGIGQSITFSELNEHEQGTLLILSEIKRKPENRDRLINSTGIGNAMLDRCIKIGSAGQYVKSFRARGRTMIASPFYFADNLEELVDVSAKVGAKDIESVLELVKGNQGWPLSLLDRTAPVGGNRLDEPKRQLLVHLCSEGVLKPPSIDFKGTRESFIFTPAPGNQRLNSASREVYERAMALVSCVRKGQLLADRYRIRDPIAIIAALRDRGFLGANSEAANQYRNLVYLHVGYLKQVGAERWEFHLRRTEENLKAVEIALDLLSMGESSELRVNEEARLALSKDERYIQSIISSAEMKKRERIQLTEESKEQFEQLLLSYD